MALLKRKRKNRRSEREYLLDVKVRRRTVRAARLRLLGLFLSASFATCFIAFGLWRGAEWMADHLVFKNDAFAIREIQIQTDGLIGVEHLRRWAMVNRGDNLIALDLARIKRDLEMAPAIRSVTVERILPGTLRIRVSEREPVVQVLTLRLRPDGEYEHEIYHLDNAGYVMPPLDPRLRSAQPALPHEYLPILSGIDLADLRPGRRVESHQVHAAIQLASQFEMSPMFGLVDIQRIDVGAPDVLIAYTDQGSEVSFSLHGFDLQLGRWRIIHDHFAALEKVITTLDLSISNNVPVRPSEAGPRLPKPNPLRHRRNV